MALLKNINNKVRFKVSNDGYAFRDRVIANGGTLTTNELRAIDYWITSYKNIMCDDGVTPLWDKIITYAPLVGGTAESCAVMVKWESNNITWYNTTSGMFTEGFQGNPAIYAYGDSGLIGTDLVHHDSNLSFYTKDLKSTGGLYNRKAASYMGYSGLGGGDSHYSLNYQPGTSTENNVSVIGEGYRGTVQVFMSIVSNGFYSFSKIGGSYSSGCHNGIIASTSSTTASDGLLRYKMLFGATSYMATNVPNTAYGNIGCSPASHQSFFIGKGFTANEELKRYYIEQNFQSMLNRAV